MIVHLATDEKFIDAAYYIYNKAFAGKNIFFILNANKNGAKHLSSSNEYHYLEKSANYIEQIRKELSASSILVFHGMSVEHARISHAFKNLKQIWTVFGKEFYENPFVETPSPFGPLTFKHYLGLKFLIKKQFRNVYFRFFSKREDPYKIITSAFNNVDFISILYEEEFDRFVKSRLFKKKVGFIRFTYYPINLVIKDEMVDSNSTNILVGNSATFTNNHLEVFDILKDLRIDTRQVIVPLSYGDPNYIHSILSKGSEILKSNFRALLSFMTLSDYQRIMQTCGVVIMNHYRQQAVGNVLNSIYMGAKVYLSNRNTLFHFLKRLGCFVYTIEDDLSPENELALHPLSVDQIELNRCILARELKLDIIVSRLKTSFSDNFDVN